jgi:hypothetical protein
MKMRIIITIVLFNLIHLNSFAQEFNQVDSYVRTLDFKPSASLENVATKITDPFETDIEKIRAIYFWIASNVKYDYEGIETYNWENYSSYEEILNATFKNRKGICSGYSHLFKRMAEISEIECEVVSGYARGDLETIFVKEVNHAWNRVLIKDKWQLLDVTWARDTLRRQVDDFYFLTDPELFILNHFPEHIESTSTDQKYSYEDFMNFPLYTPSFHSSNFSNHISKLGLIKPVSDTVRIDIRPNEECILLPTWYDLISNELKLFVPRKSSFLLQVGALTQSDSSFSVQEELIYYIVDNN